ncbi:hypothetical protein ACWDG1_44755 [Streptomyces sp. NPDC001177]
MQAVETVVGESEVSAALDDRALVSDRGLYHWRWLLPEQWQANARVFLENRQVTGGALPSTDLPQQSWPHVARSCPASWCRDQALRGAPV